MVRIVKTEFYKLKRYHILWAGVAFVVIISAVFILCTKETEPQKAKKKAKKVITKKGW